MDFLLDVFRSKVDVKVWVDKTSLQPGDGLQVRVELLPKTDFYVRRGKVELLCVESYVDKVSGRHGSSYHKRTDTVTVAEETFMENTDVTPVGDAYGSGAGYGSQRDYGSEGDYEYGVELCVPQGVLPTMNAAMVKQKKPGIAWKLRVSLDVPKAVDVRESMPLVVFKPPSLGDLPSSPVVMESKKNHSVLTLSLVGGHARFGGILKGSLNVLMLKDVPVYEARVELVKVERFGDVGHVEDMSAVIVEHDVELTAGQAQQWDFQLDVPSAGLPSLRTRYSYVKWFVRASLDVRWRFDPVVEQYITVDF
ncbi:MAG: hypothetical protein OXI96_02690 [Acidimicrobiaceae bacterium]|nr:hypothetical protein [Acidimicrobiaceae bacterium]